MSSLLSDVVAVGAITGTAMFFLWWGFHPDSHPIIWTCRAVINYRRLSSVRDPTLKLIIAEIMELESVIDSIRSEGSSSSINNSILQFKLERIRALNKMVDEYYKSKPIQRGTCNACLEEGTVLIDHADEIYTVCLKCVHATSVAHQAKQNWRQDVAPQQT